MRSSYMPDKQAEAVLWSANFAELVTNDPDSYGLTSVQAGAFGAVNAALQTAFVAAANPQTRTRASVARKDDAMEAMRASARGLVSIIQGTPGVTDAQKYDLGLTVRSTTPSVLPAPRVAPFLRVARVSGRTITVELRQMADRRGKPAGVAGATLFTHVGPDAPTSMGQWQFAATVTRPTVDLPFGPSGTGDTVWITAFWTNAKAEAGPSAPATSVNLPAGGVLPVELAEAARLKIAA